MKKGLTLLSIFTLSTQLLLPIQVFAEYAESENTKNVDELIINEDTDGHKREKKIELNFTESDELNTHTNDDELNNIEGSNIEDKEDNESISEDEENSNSEKIPENDNQKKESIVPIEDAKSTFSLKSQKQIEGTKYHLVESGETLDSIAKFHNVTTEEIISWNKLDNNIIKIGEVLSVNGNNIYSKLNNEKITFTSNSAFLNYISPIAERVAKKHGLYTSVMLAQLIHESKWGKSTLAVHGNNLGGVKAHDNYTGASIYKTTWEEINGERVVVKVAFKLYTSYEESVIDNALKLKNGTSWDPNYYAGSWVENTASHIDSTSWLTGRYATDSNYKHRLNKYINDYNLTRFDKHISITNPIVSQRDYNISLPIGPDKFDIYSQPYGTASYKHLGDTTDFVNKIVHIKEEKVNNLGTWWLFYEGTNKVGWVKKEAFNFYTVLSTKNVKYNAVVTNAWSINNKPWGVKSFERVDNAGSYLGQVVTVVQEKRTEKSTYALIESNGKEIGWIDINALDKIELLSTTNVSYSAVVEKSWSINSEPWGLNNYKNVGNGGSYLGNIVQVTQEKKTDRSTYALITINGKEIGWIDRNALNRYPILSVDNTNYVAKVNKAWSINNKPWGVLGFKKVSSGEKYLEDLVTVIQEKKTLRSTYALIAVSGKEIGWIDINALEPIKTVSTRNVQYNAVVSQSWSINSEPWGLEGSKKISNGTLYLGQVMSVVQEKTTQRSTYGLIEINGERIGWIDINALNKIELLLTRKVNYIASLERAWSINSEPWGLNNYKQVGNGGSYLGELVQVVEEKQTTRSTYALIYVNGKKIGWIDKNALNEYPILSSKKTNYVAKVDKSWSINSKPWGVLGYKQVASGSYYLGEYVTVVEVQTTTRSTYALLNIAGKDIGWIDINALEPIKVLSTKNIKYIGTVARSWSINSYPWGLENSKTVGNGGTYLGQEVTVVQEKTTQRSTYSLIELNGKRLGWIDRNALNTVTLLSTNNVNYLAKVDKAWSINSEPWGLNNYKSVDNGGNYLGQTVRVVQQKLTDRSIYALIQKNGKDIGWIDRNALEKAPMVYIDAGHGGSDPGAQSNRAVEKEMNLNLSKKVQRILESKGYIVMMSRDNDSTVGLGARAEEANQLGVDIFVSIHHNAFNGVTQGIETFYYNEKGNTDNEYANDSNRIKDSKSLADNIQKELINETGAVDRGVKRADFNVIRNTEMPAVLVEAGFIDNAVERTKLLLNSYQEKISNAISNGIDRFFALWNL